MLKFNNSNYLSIDIKGICKYLFENKHKNDLNISRIENYIKNRSNDCIDLVAIFGKCRIIKSKGKKDRKLIIVCDDAILYDNNVNEDTITIQKFRKKNFILFSQNINKSNFEDICDKLMKYPYIQETTEEGYKECLGPEIGSTIKCLINSVRLNG